jgi:hypothetical protein
MSKLALTTQIHHLAGLKRLLGRCLASAEHTA